MIILLHLVPYTTGLLLTKFFFSYLTISSKQWQKNHFDIRIQTCDCFLQIRKRFQLYAKSKGFYF